MKGSRYKDFNVDTIRTTNQISTPALLTGSMNNAHWPPQLFFLSLTVLSDHRCDNSYRILCIRSSVLHSDLCRHPVQQPHHGPLHPQSPSSSAMSTFSNLTNNQTGPASLANYFQVAKRPKLNESRAWNGSCTSYSCCGIPPRRRMFVEPRSASLGLGLHCLLSSDLETSSVFSTLRTIAIDQLTCRSVSGVVWSEEKWLFGTRDYRAQDHAGWLQRAEVRGSSSRIFDSSTAQGHLRKSTRAWTAIGFYEKLDRHRIRRTIGSFDNSSPRFLEQYETGTIHNTRKSWPLFKVARRKG